MTSDGPHSSHGYRLWAQESGEGGDVLVALIHGSLDRAAGMAMVSRNIRHHKTLRYDRRGYARSVGHPGPFTMKGNADDLEELLDGRRAILIGHSYGGNVALAVAARLGDQIIGVSTYEAPLSWQSWWPTGTAGAAAASAEAPQAAEAFMIRLIGKERWEALPESTRQQRRREGTALKAELLDLRERAAWEPREISCPVLAGCGTRGAEHHRRGARWIAGQVARGILVEVEGAAHGAPTTHPRAFVDQLVRPHLEGRFTFNVTS